MDERVMTQAEVFFSQIKEVNFECVFGGGETELVFTDDSRAYVLDGEIYHEGMIDD